MPPKTKRKTALAQQLDVPYSTDTVRALAYERDPEDIKRLRAEEDARARYARDMNMAVSTVGAAGTGDPNVYIDRIGNKPQNVLINRLGAPAPAPVPVDPQKKSLFSRYSPLGMALLGMFRGAL